MNQPVQKKHLLVVEDENAHIALIERSLETVASDYSIKTVRTLADARREIQEQKPDIALVDYRLPDGDGDEIMSLAAGSFPVIIMTGYGDEELAVRAIKSGVQDYIVKSPEVFSAIPRIFKRALHSWGLVEEHKRAERYQALSSEVLGILNRPLALPDMVRDVIAAIRRETGFDAVGIRLRSRDDFPYFDQNGFSSDFLLAENTLVERGEDGGVCRDKDGNISLECTCGLVISGKTDPSNPLFTPGGSCWTNDSFPLLEIPPDQDPRLHPRNRCIHDGYASIALIPIREDQRIVGLLQLNSRKKDSLTLDVVRFLEGICASIGIGLMRKQVEAALVKSEEKYRALVETTHTGFLILDGKGRVLDANAEYVRLSGHQTLGEILGRSVIEWTAAHSREKNIEAIASCFREGSVKGLEIDYSGADGRITSVEISATVEGDGDNLRVMSLCRDITARKLMEELIRKKDIQFRKLSANVAGLMFQFTRRPDGSYCVPIASEGIKDIFGCSPEDVLENFAPIASVIFPEDSARVISDIEHSAKHLTVFTCEFRVQIPGKPIQWIYSSSTPEKLDDGSITWYGFNMDITGRKKAEEVEKELRGKLERAARMESLGVLAGGVAHDLNNVLGPLVMLPDMAAEYIERHGDPADPDHTDTLEVMQTIKESAHRAAAVVSDLVVMGRRGQFRLEPLDVNVVVEQMISTKQIRAMQSRLPDVKVSKQLAKKPLWCLGSDTRLARVLANLVGNAAEAIDGQGDVVVRTGREVLGEARAGYEVVPPGDYVTIEVSDTGCGMDAATIARIFEPFFSTKEPSERSGSGLGLSVVHGLVRDHEGFLDVKSEVGEGTTFTVYLPAVAAGKVSKGSSKKSMRGGHERILVVDDEPHQQFLCMRQLKKLGYEVKVASSGEEAVALLESATRDGKPMPFDLVMMDMIMKGMDGLAACKAVRGLYPDQKLMVASGHAPDGYEKEVKTLGADWLNKPYTAEELACGVRARLDR